MNLANQLRDFIITEFGADHPGLAVEIDDDLLQRGVIDSMGVLQIVNFIEQNFGVRVGDDEITVENFQTIQAMARLIAGKTGPAASGNGNA